ncbi:Uncharacterised protein [Klebsiella pneumoniae]|nr:Uncharacterised protein [Klebsiella pneumoniae]
MQPGHLHPLCNGSTDRYRDADTSLPRCLHTAYLPACRRRRRGELAIAPRVAPQLTGLVQLDNSLRHSALIAAQRGDRQHHQRHRQHGLRQAKPPLTLQGI